ncbi:MAG: YlxR family protein, partial [Desulfonatronovibrio sp.]
STKGSGHIPVRTCVVCRARKPKFMLMRFTCPTDHENQLIPDPEAKAPGRGFYACLNSGCVENISRFRAWTQKCKGVFNNVR